MRISDWSSDVCSSDLRNTLMTTHPLGKIGRCVLWFSPVVIVVVGFLAAIPWLQQPNDTFVLALHAVASIFVMGYALFISHRLQRHLVEVQISQAGFASPRSEERRGGREWVSKYK